MGCRRARRRAITGVPASGSWGPVQSSVEKKQRALRKVLWTVGFGPARAVVTGGLVTQGPLPATARCMPEGRAEVWPGQCRDGLEKAVREGCPWNPQPGALSSGTQGCPKGRHLTSGRSQGQFKVVASHVLPVM